MRRNTVVYTAYLAATLVGTGIAVRADIPVLRFAFFPYLLALVIFTGALPYLTDKKTRGEAGYAWNEAMKIAFPFLAAVCAGLILAFLARLGL